MALLMVLLGTLAATGESTLPDTVCAGETKHYWVDSTANSTYTWSIDGIVQASGTMAMFTRTWTTAGDYLLTVLETTAENCPGEEKQLQVHVKDDPPTFTAPVLATGYCMEDITDAVYNPGGTYYVNDLVPPRPDYYLLPAGSVLLDLTIVQHTCPGALSIAWVIDFAGALPPDLSGTGQISASIPPGGIQFPPGNNVITWTVTGPSGAVFVVSRTLVVLPRPDIGDIPP